MIDWKHNRSSCSQSGTHAAGTAGLESPLGLPPRLKVCINQKTLFTFQKRIRGRINIAASREERSGLPLSGLHQQRDAFGGRGNSNSYLLQIARMLKVPFCHLGDSIYMLEGRGTQTVSGAASRNLMLLRFNEAIWARGCLHLSPNPEEEGCCRRLYDFNLSNWRYS